MKERRLLSSMEARRATYSQRVKSWLATFWGRVISPGSVWPLEPYSAASLAGRLRMPHADPPAEGRRILTICNACRYCEGYCAVFPALEHCQDFGAEDLHYLANLCHNCAECYYACQYAPPHEFAVNVPQVLAAIRRDSYRHYAWPQFLAGLFERSGHLALTVLALTLGLE